MKSTAWTKQSPALEVVLPSSKDCKFPDTNGAQASRLSSNDLPQQARHPRDIPELQKGSDFGIIEDFPPVCGRFFSKPPREGAWRNAQGGRAPRALFSGIPTASRAFSLVELLMVVAIMGILMGIGFAVAPGVLKSSAMSGGLSQVASAVSLARSEAIRSRNPTYFVLAPTNSLDERSFRSYSIIQATSPRSTNFTYISRWEKLPQAVLFKLDQVPMSNRLATTNFPYPADGGAPISLPCIAFQGDGALLEDLHTVGNLPRIALQTGVRMNPGDAPTYQGSYLTNEVGVRRVTGKVFVEREK